MGPGSAEQRKNAAPRPGHDEDNVPSPHIQLPDKIIALVIDDDSGKTFRL
jgi:hypothetical protein